MINDLGMVTKQQLLTITGWEKRHLEWAIESIRKRAARPEEKELWLKAYYFPHKTTTVYSLGRLGAEYALAMQQEARRLKDPPRAQLSHYIGINDILVRLLEAGISRERLQWGSTVESTDSLIRLWEWNHKQVDRKQMIRPDALLKIDEKFKFWIEFDNNTEGPKKLERKYHDYIKTLSPISEKSPIIWVTNEEKRRTYLEENWDLLCKNFYKNQTDLPKMYFFTLKNETNFILNELGKLTLESTYDW
ncbi:MULTISPECIES: replication-relaxation family protein [unclassified Paenibacillus]|uniref:replication-relaxation family protein n=1 Tax=unclassified Paenibacillus TaxID=185978 RepID=UPI001E4F258D|nr:MULTISPECIES: replication-relaxation family protein [unclassified Paenibacillus]